jgi:hypothetical protein
MSDLVPVKINTNAVVGRGGLEIRTLGDVIQASQLIHDAGWAPKNMTAGACAVAAMHGMEAGLPLCFAIQNLAIINGRPSMYGDAIMGLIHQSGLLEELSETEYRDPRLDPKNPDGWGWKVTMKRKGLMGSMTRTYTVADAKRATLWGKSGAWSSNPGRMLLIRARCFVARDLFADVLRGLTFREVAEDEPPEPERPVEYREVNTPRLEDAFMRPAAPETELTEIPKKQRRPRSWPEAESTPPPAIPAPPPVDLPDLPYEEPEPEEGLGPSPFDVAEPVVDHTPAPAPPPASRLPASPESLKTRLSGMARQGDVLGSNEDNPAWVKEDIAELVVDCNKVGRATVMPRFLDRMSIEELKSLRETLRTRLKG